MPEMRGKGKEEMMMKIGVPLQTTFDRVWLLS